MDRWVANKFGLINFWKYDEQEFKLSNGKIIFRGSNGSGKSVTTQSFIPLLLDGDKSPSRLDPFGSTARKIENYVLVDEKEDDRISYLYMEFHKPSTDNYITIGMGIRGRRGKKLESWYFILKDGRRINKDLFLYKNTGAKFSLTSKQLEIALGEGNVYTTSQKEYMAKVNENLFGYSDIDSYKDLLKLLIQIRSPKLSKDFKPTVIYEILKESLNTLSEDDLRAMAEAMDNMDSLNMKLEELKKSREACEKIIEVLNRYNVEKLYNKAINYNKELKKVNNIDKQLELNKQELENIIVEVNEDKLKLKELENILEQAKVKETSLKGSKEYALSDEITKLEHKLYDLQQELQLKERRYNNKYNDYLYKKDKKKQIEDKIYRINNKLKEKLDDEKYYREGIYFNHEEDIYGIINEEYVDKIDNLIIYLEEYSKLIDNIYNKIVQYEQKKKELNDIEENKNKQESKVEGIKNNLNEVKEYLTTVKSEYIDSLNSYIYSLKELKIKREDILDIHKRVNGIYDKNQKDVIRNKITDIYRNISNELEIDNMKIQNAINLIDEEIEIKKKCIEELSSKKQIIEDSNELSKVKNILDTYDIPYIDFYKSIDFNEDVDDLEKNIIEGHLLNMGIIDSLIIPHKYKEEVCNLLNNKTYKIIFSNIPEEVDNICKYFRLEENEFNKNYKEDTLNVLKAIGHYDAYVTSENSTQIIKNKGYNIGILQGNTEDTYISKYIGIESRENYRRVQIQSFEKYIYELQIQKEEKNKEILSLENRKAILLKEKEEFPDISDIMESIKIIDQKEEELDREEKELNFIEGKFVQINREKQEINKQIFDASQSINIPKEKHIYEEVKEGISDYRKTLYSIKEYSNEIFSENKQKQYICETIKSIESDIDELSYEVDKQKNSIEKINNHIKGLNEAIKAYNIGKLKEEYRKVTEIIEKSPLEIQHISKQLGNKEANVENKRAAIIKLEDDLNNEKNKLRIYELMLKDELSLQYIDEIKPYDINQSVKWVIKYYGEKSIKNENISDKLYNTFNMYKGSLIDYHPKPIEIFNQYDREEDDEINEILKEGIRTDIVVKFQKKNISIYVLKEYIEGTLEEQNMLINAKEREVFEDTLINTLSTKIIAKIVRAQKWVKDIDKLMSNMNTSSGFKLFLEWKPKKSDSETELDIKELMDILQKPHFMSEDKRNKVSEHFKEKLKKQKRILNEDGTRKNYQTIIKEVLDYREWFEFKLKFIKGDKDKKELTNNQFFVLSGGEKAMAMYIPLFAAVNARYNAADKKDSPRIIALDEAFAGVDENNISSMFDLIESLNLDYVLNSQVLWGTYESVKQLSIYELIKEGEDIIIPIRYTWNGKIKEMEM